MNLYEDFKLYETLWEDSNSNTLTEGLVDNFKDTFIIYLLKKIQETDMLDYTTQILSEVLESFGRADFGEFEKAPYYLTKHKIIGLMETDLQRLSTKDWKVKWWDGFLQKGELQIDPKEYPDVNLSGFVADK